MNSSKLITFSAASPNELANLVNPQLLGGAELVTLTVTQPSAASTGSYTAWILIPIIDGGSAKQLL